MKMVDGNGVWKSGWINDGSMNLNYGWMIEARWKYETGCLIGYGRQENKPVVGRLQ